MMFKRPVLFALVLMSFGFGCSDVEPQTNGKYGWQYGDSDMGTSDSSADSSDGDMLDMVKDIPGDSSSDQTGPAQPRVEAIRYRRQFEDCTRSTCLTEIQFGMRSGIIARIQSNNSITDRQTLKEEDFEQLNKLAQTSDFIAYVESMGCPQPTEGNKYRVTLTIDVYADGQDQRFFKDVSGCYDNDMREDIDDLISYSETVFANYYK